MTNEEKNELILADISEVLRNYARRRIDAGTAVGQILIAIARPNLEQLNSEVEK